MSELFADRYDIQHELGRGAFGVVYLAHDVRLRSRPVALKVLHPALSTDPQVVRLFENEAGVLAGLRHDHIITVYDVGVWELRRYIVMDYVAGPSLAQVVREQGAQPPERVQAWLRQAAEALAYAHGQGVLHRDVKSANLLLETARDRLFVGDFGLARATEASGGSSAQSDAQALTGTAAYRAPEVHRTGHTTASDLYSLGVVGYELLAGRRPFESDDPLSLLLLHATEPVPPLPAGTPAPLAGLVMALLAKDPAQRPASAAAVVKLLADSGITPVPPPQEATALPADLPPVKPLPPPLVSSTGQPPERPPRRWLGWLASGVAVVAVLLLAVWALNRPPGAAQPLPTDTPAPPTATAQPPTATPVPLTATPKPSTETPMPTQTPTPEQPTPTPTLGIGSIKISEIDGMEMVYVPAGEFIMGSAEDEGFASERPQHTVYLSAFYVDKTEVTASQYQRCVDAGACTPANKGDHCNYGVSFKMSHPINCVDWNQAVAYCRWAGRRLPTEAEWEKAARGTDARVYPWGNDWNTNNLNSRENSLFGTTAVGSYRFGASPYGALDMAGNVWEWTADWYDQAYYAQSTRRNPTGPEQGFGRVNRGGSYCDGANFVRTTNRVTGCAGYGGFENFGFRCASAP